MKNNLESLFNQSNALLFTEFVDGKNSSVREIMIARLNLARSVYLSNEKNLDFDKLLKSLEYSLETSDEIMSLALIAKINESLVNIADSFDNISKIVKNKSK